jgi:septum formation protein
LKIILASTSKTRQTILHNAGIDFTSLDSKLAEAPIKRSAAKASPKQLALALAHEKAKLISIANPEALVIGTDQTLGLGQQLFDKPETIAEATVQLTKLRGQSHRLYSAIVCLANTNTLWSYCGEAELHMRNFSDEFLQNYLKDISATYSHSVGGYQLESAGINLFDRIEGDYFTILGLPLLPLLAFLREQRIIPS